MRDLADHRDNLIRHRATHIQYIQKAHHLMNLQLDNVITDITGKTGMAIIREIVSGERDAKRMPWIGSSVPANPGRDSILAYF